MNIVASLNEDTNETDATEEVTFYVASHLNETKKSALAQIRKIIDVLGAEQTIVYARQAREIEKSGGMLVASGRRKRSVGGIFFYLIQTQCDPYAKALIWPEVSREEVKQ